MKEAEIGIVLITTVSVSPITQDIGLYFVICTFFSGLIIYKEKIIGKQNIDCAYNIISAITFGLFVPFFYAIVGIDMNLKLLLTRYLSFWSSLQWPSLQIYVVAK